MNDRVSNVANKFNKLAVVLPRIFGFCFISCSFFRNDSKIFSNHVNFNFTALVSIGSVLNIFLNNFPLRIASLLIKLSHLSSCVYIEINVYTVKTYK